MPITVNTLLLLLMGYYNGEQHGPLNQKAVRDMWVYMCGHDGILLCNPAGSLEVSLAIAEY